MGQRSWLGDNVHAQSYMMANRILIEGTGPPQELREMEMKGEIGSERARQRQRSGTHVTSGLQRRLTLILSPYLTNKTLFVHQHSPHSSPRTRSPLRTPWDSQIKVTHTRKGSPGPSNSPTLDRHTPGKVHVVTAVFSCKTRVLPCVPAK